MRLDFFAASVDLLPSIAAFESRHAVKYLLTGMFESATTEMYSSGALIPNLGVSVHGHQASEQTYMVLDAKAEIHFREIPQRQGGSLYSLDLLRNPNWFSLTPAGIFDGRFVIPGGIGTTSKNSVAEALGRDFAREIKKRFTKIHNYYVGPNALRLMEEGWRLTLSTQTSVEFDLRRETDFTESGL